MQLNLFPLYYLMAKVKSGYAKCACCRTERHRTEVKQVLSILDKQNARLFRKLKGWGFDAYAELLDSNFYWACDYCLDTGVAVVSSMSAGQGTETPHLAYFDTTFVCNSCGIESVFSIAEKKAWYEQYNLPKSARPSKCLKCRKTESLKKDQNKLLSDLLEKKVTSLTDQELEQVIAIYTEWEKADKVAFYRAVLKKRHPGSSQLS